VVFICSGVQMLLGARVREGLDLVSASGVDVGQEDLVALLGEAFTTHRTFAWVLVVLGVVAAFWSKRAMVSGTGRVVVGLVPLTVIAQVLTGAAMAYLAIPGWAQVLHLGLSAVLCCVAFWMVLGFGESGVEGTDER
ncbi:MAG: COX15/CtaA family protein, partial [Verrucomicrobiales bacterium]|nr:COX15/CtaA family protein [Verrucomicrobiales bacterium]